MANNSPGSAPTGRSLYANLLNPSKNAPGTITSAPVTYANKQATTLEQDEAAKKQQALAGTLQPPTKRPQVAAQKQKAKAASIASRLSAIPNPGPAIGQKPVEKSHVQGQLGEHRQNETPQSTTKSGLKSTATDWMATASDDEDVNNYYASTRQRGGKKKRRKNKDGPKAQQFEEEEDWDTIYDPSKPTNIKAYRGSDEQMRQTRLWKDKLYRNRMDTNKGRKTSRSNSFGSMSGRSSEPARDRRFAPPSMSFAPPVQYHKSETQSPPEGQYHKSDTQSPLKPREQEEYVPPSAAPVPDDISGEDVYARRMRMSQRQRTPPPPPPPPTQHGFNPATQVPSQPPPTGQISRAPVRYNLPATHPAFPSTNEELADAMDVDKDDKTGPDTPNDDHPRTSRPGQSGFAQRLLESYGWEQGQGLGKEGTGITTALRAEPQKRKKKSDAEGGGFVQPATMGRIVGGHKNQAGKKAEEGKFGAMSEVVRLNGMLKGMNLQAELDSDQGGIMQEIGEECDEKYGKVERVFIYPNTGHPDGPLVFVAFVQPLSALRAINALEGRIFNGNQIRARFWAKEKFDKEEYE